jgi:hypothetical protein
MALRAVRLGGSPDGDGGVFPYQRVESRGILVRKADTAMASGAADGFGDGAAVDADAGAVQSGPEDEFECRISTFSVF